jgi:ketosteroid isomerase-like protein
MKRISLILLGLLWLPGCSGNREEEKNLATANAMFDAFNEHDWEKMASYYTPDASFLDPSFGTEYVTKSRTETAAKYAELEKMFPDIHDEVIGMYPSGKKVTIEFVSTGSISDSTKFKLPIITVLTFQDGLITKDATYYDLENQ